MERLFIYSDIPYFCSTKLLQPLFFKRKLNKPAMTKEQERRRRWIFQVFELIHIDRADFEKRLGKKGIQELIDELLDELYLLIHQNNE